MKSIGIMEYAIGTLRIVPEEIWVGSLLIDEVRRSKYYRGRKGEAEYFGGIRVKVSKEIMPLSWALVYHGVK